ncbi:hypothetical protein ASPSYDRAFT_1042863 [Aspergillus sydowii CBS 593.65]|uniref:Uncharacterized protein n=1 Tax=Aspergillus sydowii CBS 593.65 TaxID=1036612 RepID=A0A1L9TG23_9EURO|nr:uncharacterized protein ASPSYDRAFT_1042863 [Aspergillus sydowii CBS 593.65]OJJ58243.1 hypothetical protein ASPSYDRAFT_1042863 [Aspergillus sydowii CBS 593.65]
MAGKAIYLLLPVQDWLASFISGLGNGQEKVTARQSTRPFAIAGLIPCEAATFPTSLTRGRNWSIPIFIWELRHFPVLFVQSRPSMGGPFKSPSSCHLSSGSLAVGRWTSCLGCSDLTLVAKREPVLESVPRIFLFFLFIGGTGVWPCDDDANSFAMVPNFVEARLRIDYANLGRWTPLACLKSRYFPACQSSLRASSRNNKIPNWISSATRKECPEGAWAPEGILSSVATPLTIRSCPLDTNLVVVRCVRCPTLKALNF